MRINLLPVEERPLKQSSVRWEFLLVFLGIVLLICVNVLGYLQSAQIQALQQEHENLLSYKNMLMEQQRHISQMQAKNKDLRAGVDYYRQIAAGADLNPQPEELVLIVSGVPEQVWLEAVELNKSNIVVSGYTVEASLVFTYLQNLQSHGYDASVNQLDQAALGGRIISFTINAQRRD